MRRVLVALSVSVLLSACQQPTGADTAMATFDQFDRAMRRGDVEGAVKWVDFAVTAAQNNSDWDSIPTGQRNQILARMREDTIGKLRQMHYPGDGMVGQEQAVSPTIARIQATGGGKSLHLELRQLSEGWRITDGVPGMTTDTTLQGTPAGGQ